jgi:hypothetical protein
MFLKGVSENWISLDNLLRCIKVDFILFVMIKME